MVFPGGGVRRIRRDTVNERAVRILLECILVLIDCRTYFERYPEGAKEKYRARQHVVLKAKQEICDFCRHIYWLIYVAGHGFRYEFELKTRCLDCTVQKLFPLHSLGLRSPIITMPILERGSESVSGNVNKSQCRKILPHSTQISFETSFMAYSEFERDRDQD